MNWIVLIRAAFYSLVFGLLLIPYHQTVMQTICGGIILGLFASLITDDKI
jgi:hypothetical protein